MSKRAIVFYLDWPKVGMALPPTVEVHATTHPSRDISKHYRRYKFTVSVDEPEDESIDLGIIGVKP